ncbi:hypothetical protein, partial [Kitasatospora aureofaciens]|uniref:hypothetical protein n=1 Tax=Kitasatospora aureofaciens TaxID=1894 RepID=UPI0036F46311
NGRFLRTAFQRALRALRSFVFPAYQMFSAPFSGVSFIRFPLVGFPSNFARKLIRASGVLSPGVFALSEGAHFVKRARLDSAVS